MNSSRVTFAIIDAAASERHFLSPFIIGFCLINIPGSVNQNRLGIRNVEGNIPTEIIRDDEPLINYYENLRRMR